MRPPLEIALAPEQLGEGEPEEQACFGLFTIRAHEAELTGGMDSFISAYRPGPLVSGYHMAEWLAENWWRLCHEPRAATPDWWRAHRMTAIGEGYAWPNITIYSDGMQTTILSQASVRPDARPFRYVGSPPCVLPSLDFHAAVDHFIASIQARLRERHLCETTLDRIWHDVMTERRNPELARRRRIEALLGRDADTIDDHLVERLIADATEIGESAVEELAAHGGQGGTAPTAADLRQSAKMNGYDFQPPSAIRKKRGSMTPHVAPAWHRGAAAARALRAQEHLSAAPISNERLAELAGVSGKALHNTRTDPNLSFTIDATDSRSKVVFRSKWPTGRRFELARLMADRTVAPAHEPLHVATRASTYRQQIQRSFAAELLSPFEAVDAMLEGDYSAEAQLDAAKHFEVSDRTILTLLVNHGRVGREDLQDELGAAA